MPLIQQREMVPCLLYPSLIDVLLAKKTMGSWEQPTGRTVDKDGSPFAGDAAYHARHLENVLVLPSLIVLAAGPTSGVWSINPAGGPTLNWTAEWGKPNMMTSLAEVIRGDGHVFAGGDALYQTDTTNAFPLANRRQIPLTDSNLSLYTG